MLFSSINCQTLLKDDLDVYLWWERLRKNDNKGVLQLNLPYIWVPTEFAYQASLLMRMREYKIDDER